MGIKFPIGQEGTSQT